MTVRVTQPLQEEILDSVADGVFMVDRAWRITSFDKTAERLTGVPQSETLGRLCWEVFHADICENDCVLRAALTPACRPRHADTPSRNRKYIWVAIQVPGNPVQLRSGPATVIPLPR